MYHWAGEMTQNLYLSFNLPYGFNDWIINFTINTWKSIFIVLKELYWRVDYWINWDGEVQKHALNLEDSHNPKCQLQRTPVDLNILCLNSIGLFNVGIYMSQKKFNQGQDFVLGLLLTSDKEKNNKLLKKSSNCMRKNV